MIGLDISDQSIKLVQFSSKRTFDLLAHCWHPVPDGAMSKGVINDVKALQQAVRETLTLCRLPASAIRDPVIASIPETQSFLRVIEIPIMEEDEVAEAVHWEVAQHIPFGLENVYIDWQPLSSGHTPKPGRMEVLVGAAQRKVVDPLYQILRELNLDVAAFELESQAIVRALISPALQGKQGLLVVDLGASATNVIIYDHGTSRFSASLQKGAADIIAVLSPADRERVTGAPRELTGLEHLVQTLSPVQEELVAEIRGIVEFYNSTDREHAVREILLAGGGSNLPGLDAAFVRQFDNVVVQRGNPWVKILPQGKPIRPPMNLPESVHFSTAIGLALRHVLV